MGRDGFGTSLGSTSEGVGGGGLGGLVLLGGLHSENASLFAISGKRHGQSLAANSGESGRVDTVQVERVGGEFDCEWREGASSGKL